MQEVLGLARYEESEGNRKGCGEGNISIISIEGKTYSTQGEGSQQRGQARTNVSCDARPSL